MRLEIKTVDDCRYYAQCDRHDPGHQRTLLPVGVGVGRRPVVGLLFHRLLLRLDDLADLVLQHQLAGVRRVSNILKRLAALLAALLQQHLLTARMLVQELGHVIDLVVYHEPAAVVVVVLLHLRERVLFQHVCYVSGGHRALELLACGAGVGDAAAKGSHTLLRHAAIIRSVEP